MAGVVPNTATSSLHTLWEIPFVFVMLFFVCFCFVLVFPFDGK